MGPHQAWSPPRLDPSHTPYSQLEAKKRTLSGSWSAAQDIEQVGSWHSAPKLRVLEEDDRAVAQALRRRDQPQRSPSSSASSNNSTAAIFWPGGDPSPIKTPRMRSPPTQHPPMLWTQSIPADDVRRKAEHLYPLKERESAAPAAARQKAQDPPCLDGSACGVAPGCPSRARGCEFFPREGGRSSSSSTAHKGPRRACEIHDDDEKEHADAVGARGRGAGAFEGGGAGVCGGVGGVSAMLSAHTLSLGDAISSLVWGVRCSTDVPK